MIRPLSWRLPRVPPRPLPLPPGRIFAPLALSLAPARGTTSAASLLLEGGRRGRSYVVTAAQVKPGFPRFFHGLNPAMRKLRCPPDWGMVAASPKPIDSPDEPPFPMLRARLTEELKTAMKAKDQRAVATWEALR